MTLVLGIEIVRVTVFVSGLAIFFANATTLVLDTSISREIRVGLQELVIRQPRGLS